MKYTSLKVIGIDRLQRKSFSRFISFVLRHSSFIPFIALLVFAIHFTATSSAQTGPRRNGAHSAPAPEVFTPADRRIVEGAIGQTCVEQSRDPFGSMAIDEMQARPSLAVSNPDAVAGLRRAERVLPVTRKLVALTIVELAKEYDLYGNAAARSRITAATARVEAVRRIRPDVDSRDNASVLLREPRTIEFGTIFLAGLRSDEAMISVLAHELTHIASGQADSLKPLFRAVSHRAATRTGLRIQGQRAEELACDLVGMLSANRFIKDTPSWEPLPRRMARAVEHNCVDDDASDEDHLSPRSTIRALYTLDINLAREILGGGNSSRSINREQFDSALNSVESTDFGARAGNPVKWFPFLLVPDDHRAKTAVLIRVKVTGL
jgi:hypothetical protein